MLTTHKTEEKYLRKKRITERQKNNAKLRLKQTQRNKLRFGYKWLQSQKNKKEKFFAWKALKLAPFVLDGEIQKSKYGGLTGLRLARTEHHHEGLNGGREMPPVHRRSLCQPPDLSRRLDPAIHVNRSDPLHNPLRRRLLLLPPAAILAVDPVLLRRHSTPRFRPISLPLPVEPWAEPGERRGASDGHL